MRAPLALLLILAVAACGGEEPSLGEVPAIISCVRIDLDEGTACETDGQWCASTNQCGLDVTYCKCVDGAYACTEPYSAEDISACTAVPHASCILEGTGVCDQEPVGGGSCSCESGTWTCQRSCDNCPTTQPTEGEACAIAHPCRYAGSTPSQPTTCTCSFGVWACD